MREQREVDHVLVAVGDGPLRQHLLQLAHGHQAAREGQEAEQRFEHQRHHDEAGSGRVRLALVKLGRADQRRGQRAASVRERGPLRHRGHRHDVGDGNARPPMPMTKAASDPLAS